MYRTLFAFLTLALLPPVALAAPRDGPNQTAEVRQGENSPFTTALVAKLGTPEAIPEGVFKVTACAEALDQASYQPDRVAKGEAKATSPSRADLDWIRIPGGTFQMGSTKGETNESPVHSVTLSGFEMTRTEVTFGQYQACVDEGACTVPHADDGSCYYWNGKEFVQGKLPRSFRGSEQPVVCVDWDQASAYATWAGGRLPTEAEWEYAARGGQSYEFAGSSDLGVVAWYDTNSGGVTHPVGQKAQNGYGLVDMSGNAWEWVSDWYGEYSAGPETNPKGPTSGSHRADRGGSSGHLAGYARVSTRDGTNPGDRYFVLGFRLAR